jgi:hypothetical protein
MPGDEGADTMRADQDHVLVCLVMKVPIQCVPTKIMFWYAW